MQDLATDITTVMDRYVAAWNEADPERRRAAVTRLYADDERIVTPSVEVNGCPAIVEHIGEVFAEFVGPAGTAFAAPARPAIIRVSLSAGS